MYENQQTDSKAVLICTACHARRYIEQDFLDLLTKLEGEHGPDFTVDAVMPRHKPCNAFMRVELLTGEAPQRV